MPTSCCFYKRGFFLQRIFGLCIIRLNKYGVKSLEVEDFRVEEYDDNSF